MKKLILLAIGLVCTLGAYAQGTINFANSVGQEQTNTATGLKIPVGGFTYGLYYGIAGSVEADLTRIATTGVSPVSGRFTGGTVTTPNTTAPGAAAVVQIRAWTASFATYDRTEQDARRAAGVPVL
jgi:hypothetical protein